MTAKELFSKIGCNAPVPDREVVTITEVALRTDANSIFVCIKGARADGHDYAKEAYERGCRLFVAEKDLDLPIDAFVLVVKDTRLAIANLACSFYENPSHQMRLIGVTGTKGKTTTARLIAEILNAEGIPCGYIGTNGIHYADVRLDTNNTTPDAMTLQATLADMLRRGVKAAVIEVSSQALMQYRVDDTHFEGVVFTNLSPDHIGPREHRDFAHYRDCKRRLFTDFEATHAICNVDDVATEFMLDGSAIPFVTYCTAGTAEADFAARDICLLQKKDFLGVSFFLVAKGNSPISCELALTGAFNVSNALLATATAARVFGISPEAAVRTLAKTRVEGRAELIALPRGVAVIDYAHNRVSLEQLLTTLRQYSPKRLIVLFGSVGERSQMRRRELGEVVSRLADHAILTSDNPAGEDPNAIIDEIAAAFECGKATYERIPDRRHAIEHAVKLLQDGDILVLAGKGHEEYQLIGSEKIPFSERKILESVGSVSID